MGSGIIDNKDMKARAIEAYHEGMSVENVFAGTLAVGDLVYVSGHNTTSTSPFYRMPQVSKADADGGTASGEATYVVVTAIPQSGGGRVAKGALLTGLDTSSWGAAGDPVYLSTTAGESTATAPSGADDNIQRVGYVLVKSATVGEIAFNLRDNKVTKYAGTLALFLASDNTWTGTNDFSKTVTAADQLINADLSVNHATASGIAGDFSATQLTTPRTSGTLTAVKGTVTSLSGDTAGVGYYAFEAAVTVGEAGADHHAYKVGAGFDAAIDSSSAATGETDWIVGANLASAWSLRTASLDYVTLVTTTATPGINEVFTQTAAGFGHYVAYTLTSTTASGGGIRSVATSDSAARTAGTLSAFIAGTTSHANDLNGLIYANYTASAPTDGGGAVYHVGLEVRAGNDFAVLAADNARIGLGTGASNVPDVSLGWNATILDLLPAVDDSIFKIGNGTLSMDVWIYGNTASDYVEWDASNSMLAFSGAASARGLRTSSTTASAIAGATVLTLADSGGVFAVTQSSTFDIDMPSPTTGPGCSYQFVLVATGAFSPTITVLGGAGVATFIGHIQIDGATVVATGNTLTFVNGSTSVGDSVEIISVATNLYFVRAFASTAGGITIS